MKIHPIQSTISDNWFYLLTSGGDGVLIDPVDPVAAMAAVGSAGVQVSRVVNTHWHPDHTGGNTQVIAQTGAALLVPEEESGLIPGATGTLAPGDVVEVGADRGEVLFTPGHTSGHVTLRFGNVLFSGDVVFVAGAGNCHTGCPHVLYRTFTEIFAPMPDDTLFYPGHDYARRNLEFCLRVAPDSAPASAKLASLSGDDLCLTTLGEERTYNVFMRTGHADLQESLRGSHPALWAEAGGDSDAEAAFVVLRALRSRW
jgi:hydroxyacylglutathione hydrolase